MARFDYEVGEDFVESGEREGERGAGVAEAVEEFLEVLGVEGCAFGADAGARFSHLEGEVSWLHGRSGGGSVELCRSLAALSAAEKCTVGIHRAMPTSKSCRVTGEIVRRRTGSARIAVLKRPRTLIRARGPALLPTSLTSLSPLGMNLNTYGIRAGTQSSDKRTLLIQV